MKTVNTFIFSVIVLLTINTYVFSQSDVKPSRSETKSEIWHYTASNQTSGPMDANVVLEYYFFRETVGDKKLLGVNIHYKSMEYTTGPGGYRFKLNGKIYTQDEIQSWDSRGTDCFADVVLDVVSINNLGVNGANAM